MHDAGICCLVTRQGHLLYQQSRRELWGWGEDSNSLKPPSSKLFLPFRQSRTRTETLCRDDRNLLQWNGVCGNTLQCMLAGDPSAISHLASGRWHCSVSLTCCLKPSDRWQLPTDAAWWSSLPWCQRSCSVKCRFRGWCQCLCRAVARPHSYRMS